MIRALVWKEMREQRVVWVVLALASAGCAIGMCQLLPGSLHRDQIVAAALCVIAWVYGVFCGSLLFAGEAEVGTQAFLDALPASRRLLWSAKAATGLGLVAAQTIALFGIGVLFLPALATSADHLLEAAALLFFGGAGYAWGLFCGTLTPRVLVAVAWAVLLQAGVGCVVTCLAILRLLIDGSIHQAWQHKIDWTSNIYDRTAGLLWASTGLTALVMAIGSRRVYCQVDQLRQSAHVQAAGELHRSFVVLFRLAWLQLRWFFAGMALLGLAAGPLVVNFGPLAWPPVTLFAGVLCGIASFGDEQRWNAHRFLGEQRLPLGRIWLVKAGVVFAAGIGAMIIALVTAIAMICLIWTTVPHPQPWMLEQEMVYRCGPFALLVQPTMFLPIGFIYGCATGLISGLLFRRSLVSGTVAAFAAFSLLALWTPSLVGGGLHGWQIWGVPAILSIAAWLLMRPWVADRLSSVGGVRVVAVASLASGLWLAAALWYRAEGIPAGPDFIDAKAFEASLPTVEQNVGGRLTESGLRRLNEIWCAFANDTAGLKLPKPTRASGPATAVFNSPKSFTFYTAEAAKARDQGWAAADSQLGPWLDLMFRDAWTKQLREAADKPVGIVADPRQETFSSRLPPVYGAQFAALFFTARSLQQQNTGDAGAFIDNLRTSLALVWNLRYHTCEVVVRAGRGVERQTLAGVSRWLEQLNRRPDLLRRALQVLQRHEAMPQPDAEDVRQATFLVAWNTFNDPKLILREFYKDYSTSLMQREVEFLRMSWNVPWEKAHLYRLLNELFSQDKDRAAHAWKLSPRLFDWIQHLTWQYDVARNDWQNTRMSCQVRGALLQVALRLYQAEHGKAAEKLADLVPEYLPRVPTDPFDGKPFRYRLSRGEKVEWLPTNLDQNGLISFSTNSVFVDSSASKRPRLKVPSGQGILWSVGPDGQDDGGRIQGILYAEKPSPGEDVVFLVPMPPQQR